MKTTNQEGIVIKHIGGIAVKFHGDYFRKILEVDPVIMNKTNDPLICQDHKYRYVNAGQLIKTDVYTNSYYPRPYNKEVFDFCVDFFKQIISEGILLDIHSDHPNFLHIGFPETVNMLKLAKELEIAVNARFLGR